MTVLGAGIVGAASAVFSDKVFNDGRALLLGTILLAMAFMMGVTQMPFARHTPTWRKATTSVELLCTCVAALLLFGVINF